MPTVFWSLSERTKSLTIMKKKIKYKLELTTGIHASFVRILDLLHLCLLVLSFPCQSDVSVTVTDPMQNYHLPLFLQLRLHAQKPYVA